MPGCLSICNQTIPLSLSLSLFSSSLLTSLLSLPPFFLSIKKSSKQKKGGYYQCWELSAQHLRPTPPPPSPPLVSLFLPRLSALSFSRHALSSGRRV
ncbi:hypothetical protein F4778DRAFT_715772, partial [Xylariomycetidae sp. FL2044]